MSKALKKFSFILCVLLLCSAFGYVVLAWTEPSQAPPGGNVPQPLNVGPQAQEKLGPLSATQFGGSLGIGYLNPDGNSRLEGNLNVQGIGAFLKDLSVGSDGWSVGGYGAAAPSAKVLTGYYGGYGIQKLNARASVFSAIAGANPASSFSVIMVPWDGTTANLDTLCQNKINGSWHSQAAVKGNYFNQTFDGTDFFSYSTVLKSQAEFDSSKSTGTQWWIGCSTLPAWSKTSVVTGSGTANYISKWTGPGTLGNSLIFDNGTNVGIGTTAPGAKLQIGDSTADKWRYLFTGISTSGYTTTFNINDTGLYIGHNSSARSLNLQTNSLDRLTILGGGNVGIGTTSPGYKLDVQGGQVNASGGLCIAGVCKTDWSQASGPWTISGNNIYNSNSGNVGIGTASPGYKLDVNGNARVNKLYVTTIDPVYEIDGKKYATYVSDFAGGVRTETSGILRLLPQNDGGRAVIDFENLEKGSNLWLFWETSNKKMSDLVVILTPSFEGKAWYEKQDNKLVIYGDKGGSPTQISQSETWVGEVSYRLTLPRQDEQQWDNLVDE